MSTASAVGEHIFAPQAPLSEAALGYPDLEVSSVIGSQATDAAVELDLDQSAGFTDTLPTFVNDRLGGHIEQQIGKNVVRVVLPDEAYSRSNALPGSTSYAFTHWVTNMLSRALR